MARNPVSEVPGFITFEREKKGLAPKSRASLTGKSESNRVSKEGTRILGSKSKTIPGNRLEDGSTRKSSQSVSKVTANASVQPSSSESKTGMNLKKPPTSTSIKTSNSTSKRTTTSNSRPSGLVSKNSTQERPSTQKQNNPIKTTTKESTPRGLPSNSVRNSSSKSGINESQRAASKRAPPLSNSNSSAVKTRRPPSSSDESLNYSDDFEDYESDFEAYESDDDDVIEKKARGEEKSGEKATLVEDTPHDSGTYDMTVTHQRTDHMHPIQEKAERQYPNMDFITGDFNSLASKDEGFEDFKKEEHSLSDVQFHQFITFETVSKEERKLKKLKKSEMRAKKLLSMFRLDQKGEILMNMPPIPYEIYMQCYGRSNTLQVSVQTDENRPSKEVQTEEEGRRNKWTQIPGPIKDNHNNATSLNRLATLQQERLGVGDDTKNSNDADEEETNQTRPGKLKLDSKRLDRFLLIAGKRLLLLLEKKSQRVKNGSDIIVKNKQNIDFSEGHIPLPIEKLKFLKNRPVISVVLEPTVCTQCLTVHAPSSKSETEEAAAPGSTVVCVWNISEPSRPTKLLTTPTELTCCRFNWPHSHLIQGGFKEGSIALWDTTEESGFHQRMTSENTEWIFRVPSYITASRMNDTNHSDPIVGLESIRNDLNLIDSSSNHSPSQICSLDRRGLVIIWTVVQAGPTSIHLDKGQAHWSKIKLVKSKTLQAFENISSCMANACSATSLTLQNQYAFITTNTAQVVRKILTSGSSKKSLYQSTSGNHFGISCIQVCPFEENYFLAGCENGEIQLYSQQYETPLICFLGARESNSLRIKNLHWSNLKPGVFYVLDSNSCIHVWDLCSSDMYPQLSVPFAERTIASISSATCDFQTAYLAFSTMEGDVEIHQLKREWTSFDQEKCKKDLEKFICYFNILL